MVNPLNDQQQTPKRFSDLVDRREALPLVFALGLAGGVGLSMFGLNRRSSPEDVRAADLREDFRAHGRFLDPDLIRRQAVHVELGIVQGTGRHKGANEVNHQNEIRKFLDQTQRSYHRRLTQLHLPDGAVPSTAERINVLKLAFESCYPQGKVWNARHDSILDVPGPRSQCRGLTRLFTIAMLENLGPGIAEHGDQVVELLMPGADDVAHVQPGILSAEGRIYTANMTQRGPNTLYIGDLDNPPSDLRIRSADEMMAHEYLGTAAPKLLVDTMKARPGGKPNQGFGGAFPDVQAFGNGRVPEGDRPLPVVTAEEAKELQLRVNRVEYLLQKVAPTHPDTVAYLQHLPVLQGIQRRHAEALGVAGTNPDRLSDQALLSHLRAVSSISIEAQQYANSNDLYDRGLRMSAAGGLKGAAYELRERNRPKEDDGISRSVILDLTFHSRMADFDPVYRTLYETANDTIELRGYIVQNRSHLIDQMDR